MTDVRFYHLQKKKLEEALPDLLSKILERGHRVVIKASSPERLRALDDSLWTYKTDSFLPHGSAKDGFESEQPVWLTTADENPNGAKVLILTEGSETAEQGYDICCDLFDGSDDVALSQARLRWKAHIAAGLNPIYFQQDDQGRWEKKKI
jgi:DNA polymerase-3 subunit chi